MASVNRKATDREMAHAYRVIKEAFPECEPAFGGHSAYNGHRAPRVRTISFRLQDENGKYRSNVVWVLPEHLAHLTVETIRDLVAQANGKKFKKRK